MFPYLEVLSPSGGGGGGGLCFGIFRKFGLTVQTVIEFEILIKF